jgi:hypothetical protein
MIAHKFNKAHFGKEFDEAAATDGVTHYWTPYLYQFRRSQGGVGLTTSNLVRALKTVVMGTKAEKPIIMMANENEAAIANGSMTWEAWSERVVGYFTPSDTMQSRRKLLRIPRELGVSILAHNLSFNETVEMVGASTEASDVLLAYQDTLTGPFLRYLLDRNKVKQFTSLAEVQEATVAAEQHLIAQMDSIDKFGGAESQARGGKRAALATRAGGGGGGDRQPRLPRCSFCKEAHASRDCTKPNCPTCANCGIKGHKTRDCRKAKPTDTNAAAQILLKAFATQLNFRAAEGTNEGKQEFPCWKCGVLGHRANSSACKHVGEANAAGKAARAAYEARFTARRRD